MDQQAEKSKTEKVTGLGRTRQEIAKWTLMTAQRFQTGGGRDTRHPRPPFVQHGMQRLEHDVQSTTPPPPLLRTNPNYTTINKSCDKQMSLLSQRQKTALITPSLH